MILTTALNGKALLLAMATANCMVLVLSSGMDSIGEGMVLVEIDFTAVLTENVVLDITLHL